MKWFFPAHNSSAVRPVSRKTAAKLSLLLLIITVFSSFAVSLLAPKTASADTGRYNALQLLGEHCHDLESITHNFSDLADTDDYTSTCHNSDDPRGGWEEALVDSLGCSSTMFYQHKFQTDPNDNSVTKTRWYTDQGDYKDCYNKALAMYTTMSDPNGPCKLVVQGSDNYKDCTKDQDNLHIALGCDSSMFQKVEQDGREYYKIKPNAAADCKQRIDDVGNVKIVVIGADGQPTPGAPTKDASVKGAADGGGGDGGDGGDAATLGCDGSSSPLTWIICPVINDLLVPAITATDNLITQQMTIPANNIFCSTGDTCEAYYNAWSTFRNLALGLLVVAGLIVIIGQAVGLEILDAYTVRKVLPRLLVAAVGITLSWALMNFAVTLSNDLGFGIRTLITSPFSSLGLDLNFDLNSNPIINLFFGGGVAAGAAVAAAPIWIAAGGLGVLLSYVATAGLAVLVAVLVLILRQIAVIMLILVSPIALVAYVLPNTQRIFRLWWESFTRALLMFPLIAAFIAAGRVFAAISLSGAGGGGDVFHGIIGFVAYFAPYFMIPLTFRMSGGIMSGLGNFVQSRAQGGFSALSGFRGGQRQQRVARARQTGLYRKDLGQFNYRLPFDKRRGKDVRTGGFGRMMNTAGFYAINGDEMVPLKLGTTKLGGLKKKAGIPGFRRGAAVIQEQIASRRMEETAKALQHINPGYKGGRMLGGLFQGSEHDYLAGLNAKDRAEFDREFGERDNAGNLKRDEQGYIKYRTPNSYKSRLLAADIISRSSDQEAREGAIEMRAAAAAIDATNKSPDTNYVDGQLLGLEAAAADGRMSLDDIARHHNALVDHGDPEHAQHETTTLQQMATGKRTSMARGHGLTFDQNGRATVSYADPTSEKAKSATNRESAQDIFSSKAEDLWGLHGQTWVNKLSNHKMVFDPNAPEDKEHKGGRVLLTDQMKDKDSEEYRIAQEAQSQIKAIALYSSGDIGVGLQVKRIWEEAGLDPKELVFGKDPTSRETPPGSVSGGAAAAGGPGGGGATGGPAGAAGPSAPSGPGGH